MTSKEEDSTSSSQQDNRDNSTATTTTSNMIRVTLKWSKKTFECTLDRHGSALDFKATIQKLTGVPIHRQKLMAANSKGKVFWKGPLSNDFDFSNSSLSEPTSSSTTILTVTLIGSAEILTGPITKTTFVEDLTPVQIEAAKRAALHEAMKTARGMIPAMQLEPQKRHGDSNKTDVYQYNHLVKGLPQAQIEDLLLQQQEQEADDGNEPTTAASHLLGKVVMTMGLELRRAYINDLAVLSDGTLVSALDDGHIQLWKHGAQQYDVIHHAQGGGSSPALDQGGVDAVVALEARYPQVAFASAGRGSIQLWNDEGQVLLALSASPIPHATTPRGLVRLPLRHNNNTTTNDGDGDDEPVVALAAHFRSTHFSDPNQFRLPPQNEAERQRREQALARERDLQNALQRATQSVQIWYSTTSSANNRAANSSNHAAAATSQRLSLKSLVLNNVSFTISCLESIPIRASSSSSSSSSTAEIACSNACLLVSGDVSGGLFVWRVNLLDPQLLLQHQQNTSSNQEIVIQEQAYVRLLCPNGSSLAACSIVCMKSLRIGMLAVSTSTVHNHHNNGDVPYANNDGARNLTVAQARAVHIISGLENSSSCCIVATIHGHQDVVQCICELPNGDLLTGGGKMDATIKMWSEKQLYERNESSAQGSTRSSSGETQGHAPRLLVDPAKTLPSSEAGYVFALQVLLDKKPGSTHFAVAAARYNVVKILL